jgi:hypothetical protein
MAFGKNRAGVFPGTALARLDISRLIRHDGVI